MLRRIWIAVMVAALVVLPQAVGAARSSRSGAPVVRVASLPLPELQPSSPPTASVTTVSPCVQTKRAVEDRPDIKSGPLVHVVFLLAADAPEETLDTNGTLDCSLKAQNQWFRERSGLQWRLDTFMAKQGRGRPALEAIDVTYVRSPMTGSQLGGAEAVSKELRARGFNLPGKRYLTYVATGSSIVEFCGDAYWPYVPGSTAVDGKYAQVYLDSAEGCGARGFGIPGSPSYSETIAQQELIHNDGATPIGAPHAHTCAFNLGLPAHVCTGALGVTDLDPERFDVMFPFAGIPLSEKQLDIDNDDYFRHPWPIRDLETGMYFEPAP